MVEVWFFWALVAMAVCAFVIWCIAAFYISMYTPYERYRAAYRITTGVILSACCIVLFVAYAISHDTNGTHKEHLTMTDALQGFGIENDVEYPVEVGSRFDGSSGSMSVSGGLFSIDGSGAWSPATGLSLGYEYDNRSTIMEIPTQSVIFEKSDAISHSTIVLRMDVGDESSWNAPVLKGAMFERACSGGNVFIFREAHCEYTVDNQQAVRESSISLSKIISENFRDHPGSTAIVTLTPEQYDQILHG